MWLPASQAVFIFFGCVLNLVNFSEAGDLTDLDEGVELYFFGSDLPTATACKQCVEVVQRLKDDTNGTLETLRGEIEQNKWRTCARSKVECIAKFDAIKNDILEITRLNTRTPEETCRVISEELCGDSKSEDYHWTVNLPQSVGQLNVEKISPKKALKILHVTDPHSTDLYEVGRENKCLDSSCCNIYQDKTRDPELASGPWGDDRGFFRCNGPYRTFESALTDAKKKNVDMVLFGGDVMPHMYRNHTKQSVLSNLRRHTTLLSEHFNGIPIFPVLGNHDIHPTHQFPLPNLASYRSQEMNQFYADVWDMWKHWLPASAEQTFKRYRHVVVNQFFGHEHWDYFVVNNCTGKRDAVEEPTSVQFYGPSLTTFLTGYPAYRIYSTTPQSYRVDNHQTFYLDLSKANQEYLDGLQTRQRFNSSQLKEVAWEQSYDFRTLYNLENSSPEEMCKLTQRLNQDDRLMERFFVHYYQRRRTLARPGGVQCVKGICNTENIGCFLLEHGTKQC